MPNKFWKKVELATHFETHEGGIDLEHKCNVSGKKFSRKDVLARHQVLHNKEKTFNCNTCDKAFSRKDKLNIHLFTHDNKKQVHTCDACGKPLNYVPRSSMKACSKLMDLP